MSDLAFFDTNILLYADDDKSPQKQQKAISLFERHLQEGTAVVSLQVLQEYYNGATRKFGLDPKLAQSKVEVLATAVVVRFDSLDVIKAIELHRLTQLSFWDALIVHAARSAGAPVLYSEDFRHGAVLGGVRVVNPFAA